MEVARMKMMSLQACAKQEQQQQQQQQRSAPGGISASVSKMRWLAMQMLQFPVPRGCFAPSLLMTDMCVARISLWRSAPPLPSAFSIGISD
jgi:predicted amino acid dehydrogenase